MAIEHNLYLETSASRHEIRDVLVQAGIGLDARPDFEHLSKAGSPSTSVTILGNTKGSYLPDNGVVPNLCTGFRQLRRSDPDAGGQFTRETVRGVMALLKAFPDAGAYLLCFIEIPTLLYKDRQLVLAQDLTRDYEIWDAEQPYLALVDLPYTIAPLGPWAYARC